jgi:4-hydroxy-2-oxovalerate/4-hydroxy-2-oxohexanoate aldolase
MHAKREQISVEQMVKVAALDAAGVPMIRSPTAPAWGQLAAARLRPASNEEYLTVAEDEAGQGRCC